MVPPESVQLVRGQPKVPGGCPILCQPLRRRMAYSRYARTALSFSTATPTSRNLRQVAHASNRGSQYMVCPIHRSLTAMSGSSDQHPRRVPHPLPASPAKGGVFALRVNRSALCYPESMLNLDLNPEVESQLIAGAQARGLAIEGLVEELVTTHLPSLSPSQSPAQAVASIRNLRKGLRLDGLTIRELVHEGRRF